MSCLPHVLQSNDCHWIMYYTLYRTRHYVSLLPALAFRTSNLCMLAYGSVYYICKAVVL